MTITATISVTGQPDRSVSADDKAANAVLFDFNPGAHEKTTIMKALCALLIAQCEDIRKTGSPAQARTASIAITQIEIAQMCAVKSQFAK